MCNRLSNTEPCPCLAERICHCAVKTCHPPRAHCRLQNETHKRHGTKKKKKRNPDIILYIYIYIDVSSFLFTYNGGNDLFPLRRWGRGTRGGREKKKRNGLSGLWEKKFQKKRLELFTAEMANQYWGSGAIGQLFNAGFSLSSQSGWRRSIKSLSVCK